jgi:hypothetical protein
MLIYKKKKHLVNILWVLKNYLIDREQKKVNPCQDFEAVSFLIQRIEDNLDNVTERMI